jgi:16S rRNA processing protein RimM
MLTSDFTRPPDWFQGREVTLRDPVTNQIRRERIDSAWLHHGRLVLHFAGRDSIEAVDELRSWEIVITREQREPLEEGEYYYADLIGCRLIDDATGEDLGEITCWYDTGGPVLLEAGSLLMPFVPEICRLVDLETRRIRVVLPEGLRDLNN